MGLSSLQKDLKKAMSSGDSNAIIKAEKELMKKVEKMNQAMLAGKSISEDFVPSEKEIMRPKKEKVVVKRTAKTPLEELILSSNRDFSFETSKEKVERIYEGTDKIELHMLDKGKPFSVFVKFKKDQANVNFRFPDTKGLNDFLDDDDMRISFGKLRKVILSYFKNHEIFSGFEVSFPKRIVTSESDLLMKNNKNWIKQNRVKWEEILREDAAMFNLPTESISIYGSEGYLLCSELVSMNLSRGYRKCGSFTRLFIAQSQKEDVIDFLEELNYAIEN